ncbi:unnamed protein product, partial [Arabidopsis halleri]
MVFHLWLMIDLSHGYTVCYTVTQAHNISDPARNLLRLEKINSVEILSDRSRVIFEILSKEEQREVGVRRLLVFQFGFTWLALVSSGMGSDGFVLDLILVGHIISWVSKTKDVVVSLSRLYEEGFRQAISWIEQIRKISLISILFGPKGLSLGLVLDAVIDRLSHGILLFIFRWLVYTQ